MGAQLQHQAEKLADLLPPLLIEAERVAQTVQQGTHGRRRAGTGETFWQFRHYEQGDAADRIDWRQSSRTDKIFIREREWEAAQSIYLWADISGSMQFSSEKNLPQKAYRAQLLMLALASLALRGGERVIWLDRRNISVHGKKGLENIVARMGTHSLDSNESLPPAVPIARHAQIVLCSDFLMPSESLEAQLRQYTSLNLRGAFLHILDPIEEHFSLDGRVELKGCEGEAPLLVPNATALHESYQTQLKNHKEYLKHVARSAGWHYAQHVTNERPHLALMNLYQYLIADRGLY